ncbi:MAG: hypothetical protein AAGA03_13975 [Planctomycetota bacterium]
MHPILTPLIALVSLIAVADSRVQADDVATQVADESESLKRALQYLVESEQDGATVVLELARRSVFNWSNPVFGTTHGAVYLWTQGERPVVAMKTYRTKNGRWFEQWRSLSEERIRARPGKDASPFWRPMATAEPMRPLPQVPTVPANDRQRLLQMKAIQRSLTIKADIVNAGGTQTLRPLPTPLFRYNTDSVVDGAVFAFAQEASPEVLLIVEARANEQTTRWYYRLASIGIVAVTAEIDGQSVWSEPRRTAQTTRPTDLYDGRRLPAD